MIGFSRILLLSWAVLSLGFMTASFASLEDETNIYPVSQISSVVSLPQQ